ncbi:MAG: hypothetical protein ACREDF_06685, partial [Thermoplasmata archaeon]
MPSKHRSSIIKNQDVAAATFVVGADLEVADFKTIQEALNNLPPEGGSIYVLEGTYSITATITLPDKPVLIVGADDSTIIDLGANAIAAFTVPNPLTAVRRYDLKSLHIRGTNVAGQEAFRLAETGNRGNIFLEDCKITAIETYANWTAYSYARQSLVNALRCTIFPSSNANPVLAKTPNPANSFIGNVGVKFFDCILFDIEVAVRSWTYEVDGDLWLSDISSLRMRAGSFNGNGLEAQRSALNLHKDAPDADVNFYGNGWDLYNFIQDCSLNAYDLGVTPGPAHRFVLRGARWFVGNCTWGHSTNARVLVLSTASRSVVSACYIDSAGTPGLEINGNRCRVVGCTFLSSTTQLR